MPSSPLDLSTPPSYTPKFLADKILTTRSSIEEERKLVTVLFTDLSGYTAISEKLDPEEVKDTTTTIFAEVAQIVSRYEGFIEKYMGDAVLALFGVPVAHEDDHLRAVRAAQEIHESIEVIATRHEQRFGRRLAFHTGITTGLVVTGEVNFEKGTHGVAGDTINCASRLCGLARPGQILVGESTYLQSNGTFSFERLQPVVVKGKFEPVTPYLLLSKKQLSSGGLAAKGITSPLVGRNAEVTAIKGCLNRLLDGQGGIVSIIGEAGLGKSRLIAEIRHYFARENILWLVGRTLSYGQKMSYWPFREILLKYANIKEDDTDTKAWEKIEAKIVDLFQTESGEILPYLASLIALEVRGALGDNLKHMEGESMGKQIYLSSRRFFDRLAQIQPLVLIFEDLHWADESTVALIEHLFPLVTRVPLLICCVSRPEVNVPTGRLQKRADKDYERRYTEIRLDPLSHTETANLMENLLPIENLPSHIRQLILTKADGNPFFVEEIMRMLIDRRAVRHENSRWTVTSSIETITIPDTIQGVITARIDRLDEEVKQILKTASVIGRAFLYRLLKEVTAAVKELDRHLGTLTSTELIRERQKVPELEYIFKHALVQESTYESILLKKRLELHAKVASAIEQLFSNRLDEFSPVLAYHYAKAEQWEKAQEYLFRAGDQAGRIAADAETLSYYDEALVTYTRVFGDTWDPVERAMLERKMGEAFYRRGDHGKAGEYLQRALGYLSSPLPKNAWGVRRALLHEILVQTGHRLMPGRLVKIGPNGNPATEEEARIYEAIAWITVMGDPVRYLLGILRLANFSESTGYRPGIIVGLAGLGVAGDFLGLRKLGGYYGRRTLSIGEKGGRKEEISYAFMGLMLHNLFKGSVTETIDCGLRSAEGYRTSGYWNLHGWAVAARVTCEGFNYLGNFAEASKRATELLRFGDGANDRQVKCWGLWVSGMTQYGAGRIDEAISNLSQAMEIAKSVPDALLSGLAAGYLGKCYIRRENLSAAMGTFREAKEFVKLHKGPKLSKCFLSPGMAEAFLTAAERSDGADRRRWLKESKQACREALRISTRYFRPSLPEATRFKGTYEWLQGRSSAAQKWWTRSLEQCQKIGMRYQEGLTHLEIGRFLRDMAHLQQAETVFAEIGAEFDLARTKRLLESLSLMNPQETRTLTSADNYKHSMDHPALLGEMHDCYGKQAHLHGALEQEEFRQVPTGYHS